MSFQRIISLVPSLTELLIDLGLKERLIGRTRFCIHPESEVKDIPIIGGTKNPSIDKVLALKPDYILANSEENRKEDVLRLRAETHVNVTEINTIEDALMTIHELGADLEKPQKAASLISSIQKELDDIPELPTVRTSYLIWREPWMVAASDTYIDNVLSHWYLDNVFANQRRYPEITPGQLAEEQPELILLSSEPYPFKEKHVKEIREYCPDSTILLVDGEWFSWYGSRMLPSFRSLNKWRAALTL